MCLWRAGADARGVCDLCGMKRAAGRARAAKTCRLAQTASDGGKGPIHLRSSPPASCCSTLGPLHPSTQHTLSPAHGLPALSSRHTDTHNWTVASLKHLFRNVSADTVCIKNILYSGRQLCAGCSGNLSLSLSLSVFFFLSQPPHLGPEAVVPSHSLRQLPQCPSVHLSHPLPLALTLTISPPVPPPHRALQPPHIHLQTPPRGASFRGGPQRQTSCRMVMVSSWSPSLRSLAC